MESLNLQHLAIICDGNRRWGRANGLKMSVDFYLKSGLNGRDIAIAAFEQGVQNVSVWIGSVSNLVSRDRTEVAALDKAYRKFFEDQENLDYALKNQVILECIGRWHELLKPETVAVIEKAMAATAHFPADSRRFTVLIGYDGNDERGAALGKILQKGSIEKSPPLGQPNSYETSQKLASLLRQNSWTGHLPDVDLLIRTGSKSDPHNSAGFLSLLTDNVQYAFVDTLWPDFTSDHLTQILSDFAARERRMGK